MPRALAIVLVYVIATAMFALLDYVAVKTLIPQLNSLAHNVGNFVSPGSNGQDSPLVQLLKRVGFTQSQIDAAAT
jgi:predicted PurR-regulated permease PerM